MHDLSGHSVHVHSILCASIYIDYGACASNEDHVVHTLIRIKWMHLLYLNPCAIIGTLLKDDINPDQKYHRDQHHDH